ncbi:uncharacterized protein [Clytia hemisphaerica]|uniref:uncharacterized protein n=1 Tax=Clytia hemisphaerica TaxID=252671 RepID=UPI0034D521E2
MDVRTAIQGLNKNKAPDPFGIKAEHLINAMYSQNLSSYLAQLINDIFQNESLPNLLSRSYIIPVIKSYRKPDHKNAQFGFASDASTLHAAFLINDTILKYNTEGTPVYICSLDAEKAFDSCNWYQLFDKLHQNNTLPKLVIRFLINLYMNGEANTKYKGTVSNSFTLSQGVRQGS